LLLRLPEDHIFFAAFAGAHKDENPAPIIITDVSGTRRHITGLYAAISFDEGNTWANTRLVSDDGPGTQLEAMDDRPFTMGFDTAEPLGYISVCQTKNKLIHLISSRQHYTFNLAWLKTPPPAE
jgi:hypothetical protein